VPVTVLQSVTGPGRLKGEALGFFRNQLKPRILGLLLILLGYVLLKVAVLLVSFNKPEGDFYTVSYPLSQQLGFGLLALLGFGLMLRGLWRSLAGIGVGLWAGTLKGIAVGALLVGGLGGAFYLLGIYAMLTGDKALSEHSLLVWGRGHGGFDD
jgi:polyferredoxin